MQDSPGRAPHPSPTLSSTATSSPPDGRGGSYSGNKPHTTHTHTHDTHRHAHTQHTQACTIHTRDTHNTDVHTHTRNTHRHARTYTHNTHVCAHLKGPPASYHLLYGTCPVRRSEADSGRKGDGNRRAESWPSTFSSACLMNLRRSILCFHLTANAKDG